MHRKLICYLFKIFALVFFIYANASLTFAEIAPRASVSDPHIQILKYDPDQVYKITGLVGYVTAIQFSQSEKIISVNIGDPALWTVNVQLNVLNIKPSNPNANTNLNVVTSERMYQFFLTTANSDISGVANSSNQITPKNVAFLVKFNYPENKSDENKQAKQIKPEYHVKYSAYGDTALAPITVYDDGLFTYFLFSDYKVIPAIFSVDAKKNEAVVNYHISKDGWIVVETTAKQFTLRDGGTVATVFNDN